MKKSFKLILFIPLFVLFIQSSCKKDTPKITTYGAYKFAAKVNGQDFIPSGDVFNEPIVTQYQVSPTTPGKFNYYIVAYRTDKSSIELYIDNFKGVGTYSLNTFTYGYPQQFEPPSCGMYYKTSGYNTSLWITNSIESGSITFTEYSNGKTSCSFSFKAKNLQDGSTVEVTNGFLSKN